jgi:microsomal dipeptidase-like Zn-dependent dipeptidase
MSNNLFDEEIEAVYETKGIIGITLEERALGGGVYKRIGDYQSGAYNYQHLPAGQQSIYCFADRNLQTYFSDKIADPIRLKDSLAMAEPFMRNLFYIVEHSKPHGTACCKDISCWEQVSIGSDFDGIINPIDICPTAASIPGFYQFLCRSYPFFEAYLKKAHLRFGQSPETLLKLVFYKNGERFILSHF